MPTIQEIASQEGYKAIVLSDTEATVSQAYTGDLLSDVMGNARTIARLSRSRRTRTRSQSLPWRASR
jgi:hypothetical protein